MKQSYNTASFLILGTTLFSCFSNNQQTIRLISTIDSTLQVKATSILESKPSEINAQYSLIIITKVQTGQIKSMTGLIL